MFDNLMFSLILPDKKMPELPFKITSQKGSPFVVTANGQRCYMGVIWPMGSSYLPERTLPILDTVNTSASADGLPVSVLFNTGKSNIIKKYRYIYRFCYFPQVSFHGILGILEKIGAM